MILIADILLVAGALSATFYCLILSRRLAKFNSLENGVGGAIAALSVQVNDMTTTLENAQSAAGKSTENLAGLTTKAEAVAQQLELMMASMHDLPRVQKPSPAAQQPVNAETVFLRHQNNGLEAAK